MDTDKIILELALNLSKDIYRDSLQPSVQTLGQELEQLVSALKIITLPFAAMGMSSDYLLARFGTFLSRSIQKVKPENRTPPHPSISVPILQNVQLVFDKENLCELYSNLLASASDKTKQSMVHPSFVTIISQLDPLDVLLLEQLRTDAMLPFMEVKSIPKNSVSLSYSIVEPFCLIAGHEKDYENIAASLRNLQRLGLLQKSTAMVQANKLDTFQEIYNSAPFASTRNILEKIQREQLSLESTSITAIKGCFVLTVLGRKFLLSCLEPRP